MITPLIVGILAVFFAFLGRYKDKGFKYGLEISFLIITVFLAIRYNYGNDYRAYFEGFQEIAGGFTFTDLLSFNEYTAYTEKEHFEIGWRILNILCIPIGFFGMIILLSIFESAVLYHFIKKYVDPEWYWLGVFIYVFSSGLMLVMSSMMRQTLAMTLFLCAIPYIIDKKIIRAFLLVALAAQFHKSAWAMLPFISWGYINDKRLYNIYSLLIIVSFLILYLFSYKLNSIALGVVQSSGVFNTYEGYVLNEANRTKLGTGLGIFFSFFICLLMLYTSKNLEIPKRLIVMLFVLQYMFVVLGFQIHLVSRVGYYFQLLIIAAFPITIKSIKSIYLKYGVLWTFIFITMYSYRGFFASTVWKDAFATYQTIFSAPQWY